MEIQFEKYIRDTLEAKELGNAYQFVFDKMENEGQELIDNQYILSADLITIREWEKFLSIPFDETLSLEDRRQQVLLYMNLKPPYTLNNIKRQLTSIVGQEVEVEVDYENLYITVDTTGSSAFIKKLVLTYLRKVLPANVVNVLGANVDTDITSYYATAPSVASIYEVEYTY